MTIAKKVLNFTVNRLTSLVCRINADQLALIPTKGPLIVVANHINFLEVPILITRLGSRSVTGFGKSIIVIGSIIVFIGIIILLAGKIPLLGK